MVVRLSRLRGALAGVACAVAAGCGGEGDGDGTAYVADLQPVNASGVEGRARLVPTGGDLLEVTVSARGLTPDRVHRQEVRGFEGRRDARCPSADADGRLEASEAQDAYGPVLLPLAPYPTVGAQGRLDYDLTLTVEAGDLQSLGSRVVVLHGKAVDDPEGDREQGYLPDLPVACGRLRAESDG